MISGTASLAVTDTFYGYSSLPLSAISWSEESKLSFTLSKSTITNMTKSTL